MPPARGGGKGAAAARRAAAAAALEAGGSADGGATASPPTRSTRATRATRKSAAAAVAAPATLEPADANDSPVPVSSTVVTDAKGGASGDVAAASDEGGHQRISENDVSPDAAAMKVYEEAGADGVPVATNGEVAPASEPLPSSSVPDQAATVPDADDPDTVSADPSSSLEAQQMTPADQSSSGPASEVVASQPGALPLPATVTQDDISDPTLMGSSSPAEGPDTTVAPAEVAGAAGGGDTTDSEDADTTATAALTLPLPSSAASSSPSVPPPSSTDAMDISPTEDQQQQGEQQPKVDEGVDTKPEDAAPGSPAKGSVSTPDADANSAVVPVKTTAAAAAASAGAASKISRKKAGGSPGQKTKGRWSAEVKADEGVKLGTVSIAGAAEAVAVAAGATNGLVLMSSNLDVKRTAEFMLAAKGHNYKAARVFVESVLASIDRKERMEKESLKRSHTAVTGGSNAVGKDSGDSNKRMRADSHAKDDAAGGAATGGGRRGRRGGRDDRSADRPGRGGDGGGHDRRDRADSRDSREAPGGSGDRDQKRKDRDGGRGSRISGGGPPFRDLENWDPEAALIRSLFVEDELDKHAITMILLIPNEKRVVGIVVGRHGLRLKKILDTSHCTITVENDNYCDKESGLRKVVLRGNVKSIILAQQMIMDLVWEEMKASVGVMQFMIPDQASSRIIGRGGAFIKQLQRESGCKINTLKDVELRSGLKSRAMNVCGNRTSMSKGLYLIARKIVSRWEYEAEWKGGDPTMPLGQGLPSNTSASRGGGGGGADDMEVDGAASYGRRSRGRRGSNRGNGESSGGGRDRDGGRDGSRGGSGRRDSDGDVRSGGRDEYARGSSNSYGAAPAVQSPAPGSMPMSPGVPSPWADPSLLASVVGAQAAAAAAAGGPAAVASAESWARLLGQIPPAARESLGIGSTPTSGGDIYQVLTAAQQQQPQQQTPQVSWQPVTLQPVPQMSTAPQAPAPVYQLPPASLVAARSVLSPSALPPQQPHFQQAPATAVQDSAPQQHQQQVVFHPAVPQSAPNTNQSPQQQQQQQQFQQQPPGMPRAPSAGAPSYQPQPQPQHQQQQIQYVTRPPAPAPGQQVVSMPPPQQQAQQVYHPATGSQPGQPQPQQQQQQAPPPQYQMQPALQQQQPQQQQQPPPSSPSQKPMVEQQQHHQQPQRYGQPQQQQQQPQHQSSGSPALQSSPAQGAPLSVSSSQHHQQQYLPPPATATEYSVSPHQHGQAAVPASATSQQAASLPSMEVRIPEASVGYVFGKGGNTIADVKAKANVSITTDSTVDGSNSRLLHVKGEMSGIQTAIQLLNDLVVKWQSLPPKRGRPGEQAAGGGGYRKRGGNERNGNGAGNRY